MKLCKTTVWGFALTVASLASSHAMADTVVTNAWVRATVRGQDATAAYMEIRSDRDTALIGARSSIAGHVALHEMQKDRDMMMMKPIGKLVITAGHTVVVGEQTHIMLEDLTRQIHVGDKVRLVLTFVDTDGTRREIAVDAVARELATPQ
jgi:periplasmic copper chaperone A